MTVPFVERKLCYGPAQFAYTKKRGARDALLLMLMSWLEAFDKRSRVALYCSDVAGAFDRVSAARLEEKLRAHGIHSQLVSVFVSWLGRREASVAIGGGTSEGISLENMVYQGTVLGPISWNRFFGDARQATQMVEFLEVIYADDLNAFKVTNECDDNKVFASIRECQDSLHSWGEANQVTFEASKESEHILCPRFPRGPNFRILGINFDCRLRMQDAAAEMTDEIGWKIRTITRVRRYYNESEIIGLYKSHILSYIEYRTPAIYHACSSTLAKVDKIQRHFVQSLGMSELDALIHFKLAPLSARRDIALLGLIHRTVLGGGPQQFQRFIRPPWRHQSVVTSARRHRFHLEDVLIPSSLQLCSRSIFGLLRVYNLLPAEVVESSFSVSSFQGRLQELLLSRAIVGCADWADTFSPRIPSYEHPLR